jgi:hypothetical protein
MTHDRRSDQWIAPAENITSFTKPAWRYMALWTCDTAGMTLECRSDPLIANAGADYVQGPDF